MSLLDDNFDIDLVTLSNMILKYIKYNTHLNSRIKWNVVIDNVKCMENPKSYYLYYSTDSINSSYNIYIYSSMDIRFGNIYSVVTRNYKPVNLIDIFNYEPTG